MSCKIIYKPQFPNYKKEEVVAFICHENGDGDQVQIINLEKLSEAAKERFDYKHRTGRILVFPATPSGYRKAMSYMVETTMPGRMEWIWKRIEENPYTIWCEEYRDDGLLRLVAHNF